MDNNQIDPKTQQKLNSPLTKGGALSGENQAFLNLIIDKVEKKEINLLSPDSLINHSIYDALPEEKKGKVDFDAVNLASTLRNIYNLWMIDKNPTYQIENLLQQVRLTKERLEEISGDVYVI